MTESLTPNLWDAASETIEGISTSLAELHETQDLTPDEIQLAATIANLISKFGGVQPPT